MALTPEVLIPRLGDVLVDQGLITKDQLTNALEIQQKLRQEGKSPLLGQVMRELGFIDQQTLDQAITQQILKLQSSLKEANETDYWLELLFRTGYLPDQQFRQLRAQCAELRVLLIASCRTAKQKPCG